MWSVRFRAAKCEMSDVRWVKVKGHSDHEGNDAADTRANWAQSGGSKGESNISNLMAYLRQRGFGKLVYPIKLLYCV